MDSSSFKYVPLNELSNITEEKDKINSGYYVDINKQLEILAESYNEQLEQNPFGVAEHDTTEYLECLKKQNNLLKSLGSSMNMVEQLEDIPNVNIENVFENMSPEDIDAIENILNNSLKGVNETFELEKVQPEQYQKIDCFEEFESDSDSVVLISKYPNHNCLEIGVAKTLIKLRRK